ncbi:MAG: hypothetical protein QHC90_06750 [Shinella sp.]|jgi:hypothetical protein|nr:hypothetical protein [Shinella sp.]
MMAPKLIAVVATALLLTACQTMTPEERRAADEDKCASYGFRRGTDAFATCLQRIDLDRRAESRSLRYSSYDAWGWDRPVYVVRPVVVRPRD